MKEVVMQSNEAPWWNLMVNWSFLAAKGMKHRNLEM